MKPGIVKLIVFFGIMVLIKSLLINAILNNHSSPAPSKTFKQDVREAIALLEGTPYKSGGVSLRGVDCSGAICLIWKLAGKPIPRMSARQMYAVFGGNRHWSKSKEFDLAWWTISPRRPFGHVGIMDADQKHFWHASLKKGFTHDEFIPGSYYDRYFKTCGRIDVNKI